MNEYIAYLESISSRFALEEAGHRSLKQLDAQRIRTHDLLLHPLLLLLLVVNVIVIAILRTMASLTPHCTKAVGRSNHVIVSRQSRLSLSLSPVFAQ
jgi:hypothetical protein